MHTACHEDLVNRICTTSIINNSFRVTQKRLQAHSHLSSRLLSTASVCSLIA